MRIPRPLFYYGSAFINEGALMMIYVAMPIFALQKFHASPLYLGLLGMVNSGFYALMSYLVGPLTDRTARRPLVILGVTGQIAGSALLPLCPQAWLFILVSAVQATLLGFFWTPLMTLFSETTPPARLSRAVGKYNISWCTGGAIGSVLSGIFYERIAPAAPFWIAAATLTLVLIFTAFGEAGRARPTHEHRAHAHPETRRHMHQAWVALLANYFIMNLLIYIFPKLAELPALRMSPEAIARLHGLRMGAMVLTFAGMGMTTGWHFRKYPLHLCFAVILVMMAAVAVIRVPWGFALPFLAFGVAAGVAYGLSVYYSMLSPDGKGSAVGVHEALLAFGSMAGPIFGGWVIAWTNRPASPFWFGMIPLAALWLMSLRLQRRRNAAEETKTMKASSIVLFLALAAGLSAPARAEKAPSRYLIERTENKDATATAHRLIPPPAGTPPPRFVPFIQPETGHRLTRISDVGDLQGLSPTYPYDGQPGRGLTNGYSKYSCVSADGQYAFAFGVQPWINALYRLSDGACMGRVVTRWGRGIGETEDVRWDLSGKPRSEHLVYFTFGTKLFCLDAVRGPMTQEVLYDFKTQILTEGHNDQATSATYRAVKLANNTTVIFDLVKGRPLPGVIPRRCGGDISPSGQWALFDGFTPNRFYRIQDLERGDTAQYVELPTREHGHDGWAWSADGRELYVFQDNKTDWIAAFDPAARERINIIHLRELGWPVNQHLGRMANPAKKGWLLMATYSGRGDIWAANQIMLIETLPAERHPRVWRIAPTCSQWPLGGKISSYFAETFASIDPAGNNIFWGSNWQGKDNLELYRVELPEDWHEALKEGQSPER